MGRVVAKDLTISYGTRSIIQGLDIAIPDNKITTIIGPNGCGKSTLLKALCTLLPYSGVVELSGKDITTYRRRDRARQLTLLPQHPTAPDGLTVKQLISRGRHPHQSWLQQWSADDDEHVQQALKITNLVGLEERRLAELSGGQRQRVWIAMVLAQDTPTLLLDEPTTYLDLTHSLDVLKLVRRLGEQDGKTVVMVLHDLNLAARFSDHVVVMGAVDGHGVICAEGAPAAVITPKLLGDVFDLDAEVITDPVSGGPLVVPR